MSETATAQRHLARRLLPERRDHMRQLQPDEREQHRVEDEREHVPERRALEAERGRRQRRRVPAGEDPGRDRGEHGRDVESLGRQVGEVAGKQRQADLRLRMVDAAAHLPDDEPTPSPIAIPPTAPTASRQPACQIENPLPTAAATAVR